MARRCGNAKCEKHHIRLRGNAQYCPACGKETFAVPLFPFYIYVSKKGLQWVAGAILAVALLVYAIIPGIQAIASKNQRDLAARVAIVDSMPEFWRAIYKSAPKEDWYSSRIKMLQKMVESAEHIPPINSDQLDLLLNVFPDKEQEALAIISPYLSE